MMNLKKRILTCVCMGLVVANCFIGNSDTNVDVDLADISNIAMASGEGEHETDPIIVPTGIVDWFKDLIGL